MVKSVLGNQGLRDWIVQRVSAIYMALFSIGLTLYLFCYPQLSFISWHALFSQAWMKIGTALFLFALLWHAWVGIWTIFTDYIHHFVIRSVLNFFVLLMLFACFFWGVLILWSV